MGFIKAALAPTVLLNSLAMKLGLVANYQHTNTTVLPNETPEATISSSETTESDKKTDEKSKSESEEAKTSTSSDETIKSSAQAQKTGNSSESSSKEDKPTTKGRYYI